MWTSYESIRKRKPDFLVEYSFIPSEAGGRKTLPFQGYRSDLQYDLADEKEPMIHMVHPEFLTADGSILLDTETPVPMQGLANMWISRFQKMWRYHRTIATPGRRCWLVEGSRKVAEARVVELIGLAHQIDQPEISN